MNYKGTILEMFNINAYAGETGATAGEAVSAVAIVAGWWPAAMAIST